MAELLLALIFGLIIAAAFAYGLGRPAPWGGFLWFFLVIFLVGWVVALWVEPVGPAVWGIAWLPVLFAGLLVALLIAALAAPAPRPSGAVAPAAEAAADETAAGVGLFFWLLLVVLFIAIALGYWW